MKLKSKIKLLVFIFLFFIIIFSHKIYATSGVINENNVNMREQASTNSKKITQLNKNTTVEVVEEKGDWCKVTYNGKTGYVFAKYINIEKEEVSEEETTEEINMQLYIESGESIKLMPTIFSSNIYTVTERTIVTIIKQLNNWTYVSVNNIKGWIRTDKIQENNSELKIEAEAIEKKDNEIQDINIEKQDKKTEETVNQEISNKEIKKQYIKYDTVNLRKSANVNSEILAKLQLNEEVSVVELTNNVWTKVKYGDSLIGYVSSELLADSKQEINTTVAKDATTSRSGEERETENNNKATEISSTFNSVTVTGEDIANYAKQFLGCEYVYGGNSPSGFDCSGLTSYVYKHFGYTISRSSVAQAKDGREVAKSELKPGDLLIYKNTSLTKIGHVGIYIGDNKMIHASEPGVGVIITDIDSKAYKYPQRYVTARRIL